MNRRRRATGLTLAAAIFLAAPIPWDEARAAASGALQFVGENSIDHTPKDEKVRLMLGDAFDVVGDRKQTDRIRY